jgi:hypothetical protein
LPGLRDLWGFWGLRVRRDGGAGRPLEALEPFAAGFFPAVLRVVRRGVPSDQFADCLAG